MPFSFAPPARSFLDRPVLAPQDLHRGDVAIFGAGHGWPYPPTQDVGYDVATLSADAPAAIRAGANQSSLDVDHFDFDLGGPLLGDGGRRLVDLGDLMLSPTDGAANGAAIAEATATALARGATPMLLGGDDSTPIPFLRGFPAAGPPIDVLQIDAHIDWREAIGGVRDGYSSTMRRASEHPGVRSITQVGMRGVGSARPLEVEAALAWGARLVTVSEARRIGLEALAAGIPRDGRLIVQIDCDALDPSICPAVNAPAPGGFRFEEVLALLTAAIMGGAGGGRGLAGLAIVELAPPRDPHGLSAIVAARLACIAIGAAMRDGHRSKGDIRAP